jgi:hypothetical protein
VDLGDGGARERRPLKVVKDVVRVGAVERGGKDRQDVLERNRRRRVGEGRERLAVRAGQDGGLGACDFEEEGSVASYHDCDPADARKRLTELLAELDVEAVVGVDQVLDPLGRARVELRDAARLGWAKVELDCDIDRTARERPVSSPSVAAQRDRRQLDAQSSVMSRPVQSVRIERTAAEAWHSRS